MTEKERIDKLENRVEKLENKSHEDDLTSLRQYRQLEQLIANAVKEGNKEIFSKLEDLEERVKALEDKDGEKAKLILKSISATTIGWVVLGILNNTITFFNR